jgi:tryptophanyl-tRNA synthetase
VGKDQEQHLEMTRKFAKRFNNLYRVDYFPESQPFETKKETVKIPGLDGSGKMGKSEGNGIYLIDTDDAIRKKVMKAVTDSGPTAPDSPVSEGVQNIFTIMKYVSDPATLKHFEEQYAACTIRYGDLKKQLAEDIIAVIAPIRERIHDIYNDSAYLARVTKSGAERARESADQTIAEVRRIMGIRKFY